MEEAVVEMKYDTKKAPLGKPFFKSFYEILEGFYFCAFVLDQKTHVGPFRIKN